jgi:glutamate-5-semialdehyde dehydrogenase
LLLTPERITSIVADLRKVASLPSPLGLVSKERTLSNGLYLRRVSVPFGVIGVIFEARPNVCFDVFSICFKSGNACVLKGSHTAEESNRAIIALIHDVLRETGVPTDVLALLPPTHEATANLLAAVGYVDLCIPRGGKKLIEFVRDNARVPVIETGAGVVHAYFDKDGDIEKGRNIISNAKMRRVSVCNALDCLLVHRERVADIPSLIEPMKDRVDIITDEATMGTEWMDYKMSLKIVNSIDDALAHIARYGSGHSECIITENEATAAHFQKMVDAACVYVNAPTSFTDGAQFGMGAEIGISTQKLGPRGPMALEEMTTYKWLINGDGQIRE